MRLNKDFIRHTMDGQTILVPTADASFHGLVQGNKSVAVILKCLESDTDEAAIVDAMCERFEGDREIIKEDVSDVISRLRSIGAIDD